ncbi:adhesion G protein-coupled receptor L4-like [Montipora foliosa]|uniref:adhesion G protein-coupled receptor L4-like n=1 Tax=Montipora foliosa TaxID=591990 RepID=UPI0035F13991
MKNIICLVAVFGIACLGVFSRRRQTEPNSQSNNGGADKFTSTTVPKSDGDAEQTAAERRCFDWNLVCSCGGGNARLTTDCDKLSNDTLSGRYPPTGGSKYHSAYCVEHSNSSVLCTGEAGARRWLKHKAKQCGKGNTEKEGDSGEAHNSNYEWGKGKGKPQRNRTTRSPKISNGRPKTTMPSLTNLTKELRQEIETVSKFCVTFQGNTSAKENLVLFMVNMVKDISSTVKKPDKERQEDAIEISDLCEHFVAAACLNESMPFDVQTSEFDLSVTRIFRRKRLGLEFKAGDWITISVDDTNETNGFVVMGVRYKKLHRLFTTAKNTNNTDKSRTINTHIMSASIFPPAKAELLKNVSLVFKNLKSAGNDRECVFWNLSESKWSGDNCYVNFTPGSSETTCVCNHLTHFAVLMDLTDLTHVDAKLSQTDRKLLEILTYVGLGLSILGSVITIISHWVLTERISPLFQIRVSLMSSLLTAQITFLVGINATANKGACVAAAALMHYFFMAALCWMLVEGIYLYLYTVKVYNVSHKMLVYHLLSWGKPIMVKIKLYRFRNSCNVS